MLQWGQNQMVIYETKMYFEKFKPFESNMPSVQLCHFGLLFFFPHELRLEVCCIFTTQNTLR